jgi:hypothetical protein
LCIQDVCPNTPAPMDPKWVCAHRDYYSLPAGAILKHHSAQVVLKDRRNFPLIRLLGHGPITYLSVNPPCHHCSTCTLTYTKIACGEKCDECVHRSDIATHMHTACLPCHSAFEQARLGWCGNAAYSDDAQKHFSYLRKKLGETHKAKGNVQLLPGETHKLRGVLIGVGADRRENN